MNRRTVVFLFLVFLVMPAGVARADVIVLTLSKGPALPGDATLSWAGDVPNFDVFRGPGPAGVTNPPNSMMITGGRQTIDSQIPSPGTGFYYIVTTLGPCSPLSPATICGASARCYPTEDSLTSCSGPVGMGTQCSSCGSDRDCSPKDICASGGSQCLQWCRVGVGGDCPPPYSCFSFIPILYAGPQQYGVCGCF